MATILLLIICWAAVFSSSATSIDKWQEKYKLLNDWPQPPPWKEKATVARYLVHYANWTIVSAMSPEYMQPFGTLQSYADGPLSNSTGVPYFYISQVSDTYKNIEYNNTASVTVTEFESSYCQRDGMDPEEPTCSRVTLAGKIVLITDPGEKAFAQEALFTRHPAMRHWPASHHWIFFKMNIKHVHLLDFYGGATHVPLPDYFSAKP